MYWLQGNSIELYRRYVCNDDGKGVKHIAVRPGKKLIAWSLIDCAIAFIHEQLIVTIAIVSNNNIRPSIPR